MSSDRPGGPADVVPEDDGPDPEGRTSHAANGRRFGRRAKAEKKKKGSLLRELRGKAAKIKEKREIVTR
jgi:signal peptidase I